MKVPGVRVVAALISDSEGRWLICQRGRHHPMPLKWEFPGGKIEAGERPRQALARELKEELGIEAVIGKRIARSRHTYDPRRRVELLFYAVREYVGPINNQVFEQVRWVPRERLTAYDFLEADRGVVQMIAENKIFPATATGRRL